VTAAILPRPRQSVGSALHVRLLSTRELSDALGVSESSIKRWIDSGRIVASRTDGGHRRVELPEALRFIRESGSSIDRPDLLDLPEVAIARAKQRDRLLDYLLDGDTAGARGWLAARYLEGSTIAELADGPIRDAMHALGELWRHDESGIFVEHRATDACLQAIAQLRGMLPTPSPRASCAVGGAPAGDLYLVASQVAAMVATEGGMRAVNLGPDVPIPALERAVAELRPKLVWISASMPIAPAHVRALARFLDGLPRAVTIVVGGRESAGWTLPERIRRGTAMADLATAVRSLVRPARR
jgi:MerR family transcriptional regulator, light-induced transcriptional regulator